MDNKVTTTEIENSAVRKSEVLDTSIVSANDEKLNAYHKLTKYIVNSKKLRDKMIELYEDRLEHQQIILRQKYGLDADVIKKSLYGQYLTKIAIVEKEAVDKLTTMALDRENQVIQHKNELYAQFDKHRDDLEKLRDSNNIRKEARYKREMDRLDTQEIVEIERIENNAMKLTEKSQIMFDRTIELFQENDVKSETEFGIF
jgi:hypothetical protein